MSRLVARAWPALLLAGAVLLVNSAAALMRPHSVTPAAAAARMDAPNIVMVLTDDLSWNLVPYMPHVLQMEQQGMTFTNYTVTDSLCCPSRASIFTGEFPHDTHVIDNTAPDGGFTKFTEQGLDKSTFATSLNDQGYGTGFVGKYLNEYAPTVSGGAYQPPGWTTFNGVNNGGYQGYNYVMALNTSARRYGTTAPDYLTTVAQQRGESFIKAQAAAHNRFLLEVATFAPHAPYVPAPQDVGTFAGTKYPQTPAFNRVPDNAPPWLAERSALSSTNVHNIDTGFAKRVESVQAVDRMVAALRGTVASAGLSNNTVFVFTSDNGFHMGDHGLQAGKQTAFDTDVVVPLIVVGPGIAPGSTNSDITENIDLRPTFEELAGDRTPTTVEGSSLVPLLHGNRVKWRSVAGIEHFRAPADPGDPDTQQPGSGVPPSYDAIRTATYTYVRYEDGEREYYNRTTDPYEIDNLAPTLSSATIAMLDRTVDNLTNCHGQQQCWFAGLPGRTAH